MDLDIVQHNVSKDDFIAVLEENERDAETFKCPDKTAGEIIKHHEHDAGQTYKLIRLHVEHLDNLILPGHKHVADGPLWVSMTGQPFWDIIEKYLPKNAPANSKCVSKVRDLIARRAWETRKTFVSNDPAFAVNEGHYTDYHASGEWLFGTGYHRLAAYGLWMKECGQDTPLEVYYCEAPKDG